MHPLTFPRWDAGTKRNFQNKNTLNALFRDEILILETSHIEERVQSFATSKLGHEHADMLNIVRIYAILNPRNFSTKHDHAQLK